MQWENIFDLKIHRCTLHVLEFMGMLTEIKHVRSAPVVTSFHAIASRSVLKQPVPLLGIVILLGLFSSSQEPL